MHKCWSLIVLAVSLGWISGCGAPSSDVTRVARNGMTEFRGEDGVLRRASTGYEGYLADLAYFRQWRQNLEASPRSNPKLAAELADTIAHLEQLKVERDAPGTSSLSTCGASGYSLTANVYPGFAYGSSEAGAGYVEFGPPSPWSKTLYARAWAASGAGSQYPAPRSGTFSGAGTFSIPTVSAMAGPDFCQRLYAFSSITANGCPGGYDSRTEYMDTCN
jgi:hypothetical protein